MRRKKEIYWQTSEFWKGVGVGCSIASFLSSGKFVEALKILSGALSQ